MPTSSEGLSRTRSAAPARWRDLQPADRGPIERILRATGAFLEHEVAVALELVDAPREQGYRFVVAEQERAVVGYACFGETPCTVGTYDLYWIAVDPATQGQGVGRALMAEVERRLAAEGARLLLVETAGKASYAATRAFYDRCGYTLVARVPDFYAPGDDKLIYCRRLSA
jgi:ribosomal protein S18 acetylase RimI-like enzyme